MTSTDKTYTMVFHPEDDWFTACMDPAAGADETVVVHGELREAGQVQLRESIIGRIDRVTVIISSARQVGKQLYADCARRSILAAALRVERPQPPTPANQPHGPQRKGRGGKIKRW